MEQDVKPEEPVPCGVVMATCQNDVGHPGAHWNPTVADEPGVIPLRPPWVDGSGALIVKGPTNEQ